MKLGFIGLGTMGCPMALHLVKAGHQMGVYSRRVESAEPLLKAGAKRYESPADLAKTSDVIFTMVTASSDFEEVALGSRGIVHGARRGTIVVDMETISPATTRSAAAALAEKGVELLDAPVSGGPAGAEAATLSIMAGGKREVFEFVKPLFASLGKTIVHVGDIGAGQTTKACNQLSLLVTALGVAEALTLAKASGVDPAKVREVMLGGVAASRVLELFGKKMVDRDFAAGIETRLYHKDLKIVLDLAHGMGQGLPGAGVAMQMINALVGHGKGGNDLAELVTVVEGLGRGDGET
jgi:2-hydroxy-3-oxopropionate reductase